MPNKYACIISTASLFQALICRLHFPTNHLNTTRCKYSVYMIVPDENKY